MAAQQLDQQSLLTAIGEKNSVGIDIREDNQIQNQYYDLRALRQQLRQQQEDLLLSEQAEAIQPDWQPLIDQTIALLSNHTKDIELVCWLLEGLVRKHGFIGFIDGMQLLIALITNYQKMLFPLPDEEGESTRVQPITALSGTTTPGTLIAPLNLAMLLNVNGEPMSGWDIHQRIKTDANLQEMASYLSTDILQEPQQKLTQALQCVHDLEQAIEQHYGDNLLSLRQINEQLTHFQQVITRLSKLLEIEAAADVAEDNIAISEAKTPVNNRAIATQSIQQALDYYHNNEPHSPIIYLLERSLRWQQTNLIDIFDELLAHEESKFDQEFRGYKLLFLSKDSNMLSNAVLNNLPILLIKRNLVK